MKHNLSELVMHYSVELQQEMEDCIPFGMVKCRVKAACMDALSMGMKPYTAEFGKYVRGVYEAKSCHLL